MTDDKLVEVVARAIYDALEGPVNNQDFKRQCAQWDLSKSAARAALAVAAPLIREAALREAAEHFNDRPPLAAAIRALKGSAA